ncbi:MAG: glycoside hydrolase family 75 protein [Thermodesulfobacteriota bacterium]
MKRTLYTLLIITLLALTGCMGRFESALQKDGIAGRCVSSRLATVGGVNVWRARGAGRPFLFSAGMAIDADGAPNAYHPEDIGTDRLRSAGRSGHWWALATDTGKTNGTPVIQGPGDPYPGYYVSMTALSNPAYPEQSTFHYVNSNFIPYFVLPGGSSAGARLGDLGVVYNTKNRKLMTAIYADIGPKDKIGEGSIYLATNTGVGSNPRQGGAEDGILYLVFPGSGSGRPLTEAEIERRTTEIFNDWGGLSRLRGCMN